jgi:hypothetical protein
LWIWLSRVQIPLATPSFDQGIPPRNLKKTDLWTPANLITQAEGMELKRRTMWRAKKELRVAARKSGFAGGWTWELPNGATS